MTAPTMEEAGARGRPEPVVSGFRVWPYADCYLLEPRDGTRTPSATLKVSRPDGALSAGGAPTFDGLVDDPFSACVLLGFVDLLSGSYMLLATDADVVGTLHGARVFKSTRTQLQPCSTTGSTAKLSAAEAAEETEFLVRLRTGVSEHGLFYSFTGDITTRTQKRYNKDGSLADLFSPSSSASLWQQADRRFLWNSYLLARAQAVPVAAPYLVPVVQGSFQTIHGDINGKPVEISVIARRGTSRIGTRMWRRGADDAGNVANFVESEQVLEAGHGGTAAFVQVRGSIPVYWEQIVDLTYKPKIKTVTDEPTAPLAMHIAKLREEYGSVVAVDLVNQKGGEARIGSAFALGSDNLLAKDKSSELTYVAFDFHHVCGHTHFDRLEQLYVQVASTVATQGFFLVQRDGSVSSWQTGVVRTNCVDCLDRTNVTQSLFARKALEVQLARLGVFKGLQETVSSHKDLDAAYKIAWADHGDDISRQYSGTGALKGDFVRYGKRSPRGIAQDGVNALLRYIFNNFTDGVRQDGLDLVMGHYTASAAGQSPFVRRGIDKYTNLGPVVSAFVGSLLLCFWSLGRALFGQPIFLVVAVFAATVAAAAGAMLKLFGRKFCDQPKLCSLR